MAKERILLNHNDFQKLTNGETIDKNNVKIALSDIGFDNMVDIIRINMIKKGFY